MECVAYIYGELWNVQLFMGEHRTEVCVECVSHVIVGRNNLASGCIEWSYIVSNYCSLIDVRVEAFRVGFAKSCNIDFLVECGVLHCSFYWPSRHDVISTGYVSVVPFSCIIGSLTSCNGLLDVIIDP